MYANLETIEDVFEVGLNRAVTVIAEKKEKGARGRGTPAALATLGEHPTLGGQITVRDGRFGPYVNTGKINATLPKGKDPASVTLEEAIQFLTERAEKTGAKGSGAKKKAAPAKKKAAPKKAANGKASEASEDGDAKPAKAKAKAPAKSKSAATKAKTGAAASKKPAAADDTAGVPWDAD